ncbi:MAG: hypothetical protein ACTHOD_01830 [Motilibacteraceae bacterium]
MESVSGAPAELTLPIASVVAQMLAAEPRLETRHVMLVGAWCRDLWHFTQGHDFAPRATHDVDLALALSAWEPYETLATRFPRAGSNGICFTIAGLPVDLLPFGDLEDPTGTVAPPSRGDAISVWAFAEVFQGSVPLTLSDSLTIRCASIPGYGAAKLGAWLDRSAWGEAKDASDIALLVYWYAESGDVHSRLFDTAEGQNMLIEEESDVELAAARLLGQDVAAVIGVERNAELLERWPGDLDLLTRNFRLREVPTWLGSEQRRRDVVKALTRGLMPAS